VSVKGDIDETIKTTLGSKYPGSILYTNLSQLSSPKVAYGINNVKVPLPIV
jgi:hypothetical protein